MGCSFSKSTFMDEVVKAQTLACIPTSQAQLKQAHLEDVGPKSPFENDSDVNDVYSNNDRHNTGLGCPSSEGSDVLTDELSPDETCDTQTDDEPKEEEEIPTPAQVRQR
jgi:hypothetical protein